VRRFTVSGTTVSQLWSASLSNPSGVTIDYTTQKAYVGSSDGKVYQLNLSTGAVEKQVTVSTQAIGMPTLDATAQRLHVGTLDGRICAFQLPFP
jgi:hypothetical protein